MTGPLKRVLCRALDRLKTSATRQVALAHEPLPRGRFECSEQRRDGVEDTGYFGNRPAGFVSLADVVLVVENNNYPAHSQILASSSRLVHHMLQDCCGFSKVQPLVLSQPLAGFKQADIQAFLRHSYQDQPITSELEAMQLITIADLFDSPFLMEKAVHFLEAAKGDLLQATCSSDGALHWLQVAERFGLDNFRNRCVLFVAAHFEMLQQDARIKDLSAATCCLLMRQLHNTISNRSQVLLSWNTGCDHHMCKTTYFCHNGCKNGHAALWAATSGTLRLYGFEGQGMAWCGASAGLENGYMHRPTYIPLDIYPQELPETSKDMVAYLKGTPA